MKNKKVLIIIGVILTIIILVGGYFLVKSYLDRKELMNTIAEIKESVQTYTISEEQQKVLEENIEKIDKTLSKEKNIKETKKIVESTKKIIQQIKDSNLLNLKSIEDKINAFDKEEFKEESKEKLDSLYAEYQKLKESEKYKEAEEKINEAATYVETTLQDLLKAKQPKVLTNAIKISGMKYSFNPNKQWIAIINGNMTNTTDYSFSKVVITYDAIGTETYDGGRDQDCGDAVITVKNVKPNETRKFSYNSSITNITCQFEYDKIKLKNIKAYK